MLADLVIRVLLFLQSSKAEATLCMLNVSIMVVRGAACIFGGPLRSARCVYSLLCDVFWASMHYEYLGVASRSEAFIDSHASVGACETTDVDRGDQRFNAVAMHVSTTSHATLIASACGACLAWLLEKELADRIDHASTQRPHARTWALPSWVKDHQRSRSLCGERVDDRLLTRS